MTKKKITLDKIQSLVFEEYTKNGYLEMWNLPQTKLQKMVFDIAELGLIVTEVSEAIEDIRNIKEAHYEEIEEALLTEIGYECADIIIRTLNFMTRKGLKAKYFILRKHKKNLVRGSKHGKSV